IVDHLNTQPIDVQMGVPRLKRIERPVQASDAASRELGALVFLEQPANAGAPSIRSHGKHVRPVDTLAVLLARQAEDKALEGTIRSERAGNQSADLGRDLEQGGWDALVVFRSPGLTLNSDALDVLVDGGKRPNGDVARLNDDMCTARRRWVRAEIGRG